MKRAGKQFAVGLIVIPAGLVVGFVGMCAALLGAEQIEARCAAWFVEAGLVEDGE